MGRNISHKPGRQVNPDIKKLADALAWRGFAAAAEGVRAMDERHMAASLQTWEAFDDGRIILDPGSPTSRVIRLEDLNKKKR